MAILELATKEKTDRPSEESKTIEFLLNSLRNLKRLVIECEKKVVKVA